KERRPWGVEKVPTFQLRSMAQTRAASKAFRLALSSVVVLADYAPTPAEEMPGYDAPAITPPVVEQTEPGDETAMRLALSVRIKALEKALANSVPGSDILAIWAKHCKGFTKSTAPLVNVEAVYDEMVALAKSVGVVFDDNGEVVL